jgi:AcrR family transcriptional regulator
MSVMARRRPTTPVKRDSARSRERILAAALREFSEHGLAGARVDRIARRARINKRMLYSYFGAKNELYREVMRRRFALRAAHWTALPTRHPRSQPCSGFSSDAAIRPGCA